MDNINTSAPPIADKSPEIDITSIKAGYTQWLYKGNTLIPINKSTQQLPPGVYNATWDSESNAPVPISKNINIDELLIFPSPLFSKILMDIRAFWDNKDRYIQYGSVYKRGILLYGIAGCGKSSAIMLLAKELITKHDGVVLVPQNEDEVNWILRIIPKIKEIEPDKKIIVVLEDVDAYLNNKNGSYSQSAILNFLDGGGNTDGVVTIATTNYPELLQERIVNRPSRFDRRYEVGKPSAEVRRYYIEHKLKRANINDVNVESIVVKTEGFTIDHLKEYLLSVFVLGYSHEDAMSEVSAILGTRMLKNTKDNVLGYARTD